MSLNRTSMQNMNPIGVADSALEQSKQVAAEIAVSATERRVAGSAFSMAARVLSQEIKKPIHKFTKADWKKVVDNAGELSLNFSREDAYNYQRGDLSAAMQYMAIRHKALYSMLWGEYQTNTQKAQSALFMLGLYGANGIGAALVANQIMNETGVTLDDAVQEMIDSGFFKAIGIGTPSPEKLKQAILGGFTDVLGNAVMAEAVEGDDLLRPPYSNYSASISPMAGL